MSELRVGLVGLGMMGANHSRILSELNNVNFVGIYDSIPLAEKKMPNVKTFVSVNELISQGLDYCVVATPTASHEDIALELLKNKIHILIEKPISHTYQSAIKIVNAAADSKVMGGVGHIERYNSALGQARERMLKGELGTIYQISTRRQGPYPSRIADVGVVKDLATHDIDIVRWLTGKKYLSISSQTVQRSFRGHEDMVSAIGELEDGIIVNHTVNWLSPLKERKTIITGEKGTFVVDTLRSDLTFYVNGITGVFQKELAHFRGVTQGDIINFAFDKPEPLLVEHLEFQKAVSGSASNVVTLADGAETLRVAEGMLESSAHGRTIKL